MDLLMVSDNGYKFILNYQDSLSKYVILRPLKTKTTAEVADCLVSVFFEHGPPNILHTDNGTEFLEVIPATSTMKVRDSDLSSRPIILRCLTNMHNGYNSDRWIG